MKHLFAIALLLLCGCRDNPKRETEDSYFKAGVQAAINAHLIWVKAEIEKGGSPSPGGMGVLLWEKKSAEAWIELSKKKKKKKP